MISDDEAPRCWYFFGEKDSLSTFGTDMTTSQTVALLAPDSRVAGLVQPLFGRHRYRLFQIDSVTELISGTIVPHPEVDVIVIPIRLTDGVSGLTACLQLRELRSLEHCPIVGLAFSSEHHLIQNFYEMGADIVMTEHIDAELLYYQLNSLKRLTRGSGTARPTNNSTWGTNSVDTFSSAFHASRDGMLLFDEEFRLSFGNSNARALLGIPSPADDQHIETVEKLFSTGLRKHQAKSESIQASSRKLYEEATEAEMVMTPFNGPEFTALVRIVSLYEERGASMHTAGFAASFYHLGEVHQLQNLLDQGERTQALCLISAACALQYLEPTQSGIIVSPLMRMQDSFSSVAKECALTPALTSLLEYLDLLIAPGVTVKVKMKEDLLLMVRRSDLFLILGHMILHAVNFAGARGEVLIEVSNYEPGAGVIITVSAKAGEVILSLEGSRLSQLLAHHVSTAVKRSTESEKIKAGLAVATDVAKSYRTEIQFQSPSLHETKLRVCLPGRFKGQG